MHQTAHAARIHRTIRRKGVHSCPLESIMLQRNFRAPGKKSQNIYIHSDSSWKFLKIAIHVSRRSKTYTLRYPTTKEIYNRTKTRWYINTKIQVENGLIEPGVEIKRKKKKKNSDSDQLAEKKVRFQSRCDEFRDSWEERDRRFIDDFRDFVARPFTFWRFADRRAISSAV